MKALVTGATGFIGTAVTTALARRGHHVTAFSRGEPPSCFSPAVSSLKVAPLEDYDWAHCLEGIDVVFHFAWSTVPNSSNNDPPRDASENIVGTLRLLEAIRRSGKIRFVFPSSGGTVYGKLSTVPVDESHPTRPTCAYGVSKLAIEKYISFYCQLGWLDGIALRISNPFGPRQIPSQSFGAVAQFIANAIKNEPITIYGDGSVIRDFLFIDDLAEAIVAAGEARGGYDVMNVGAGVGHSLMDVIAAIEAVLGRSLIVRHAPARNFDVPISVLDISRARAVLNWGPRVPFRDGIGATLNSLMSTQTKPDRADSHYRRA